MKKIILTIVLSSILPAIAIAEDRKMHNADPGASLMSKKHMMNSSPNAQFSSKRHMDNSNPNTSRAKSGGAKAKDQNGQGNKGWSVIKYQPK
jgi:hypothetical protein